MSINVVLDLAAAACPGRVACGSPVGGWTFGELAELAERAASVIADADCEHVAFLGLNGPAFTLAVFAAAKAGVPITPLNYRLPDSQLTALLARIPGALVLADQAFAPRLPATARVMSVEWFSKAARTAPRKTAAPNESRPAVVLFTSGTTSEPKGVVLRHDHLVSYVLGTVDLASADEDECALVSVPAYHVAGVASLLTGAYAGRRTVYLPDFSPAGWLDLVRAERVTSAMVVPTMLARIVEELAGAPARTPTLRALSYGGARMPAAVLEQALRAFPDTGFTNAYGLTETSSTIAVLSPEDHRAAAASGDPAVRARLGSAGRAVPGVELRVCEGALYVRGAQVSGEYLGQGSALDADGWFATRDRARIDADGYLFIEGRADDTIIRGGENIAPAEIEDVLLRHPAIRDAAVAGVPDEEWGERIGAMVVLHPGYDVDGAGIRGWARQRLRGSKTPDLIVIRDALPYNSTGKLVRRELTEALAEELRMESAQ
jgi:acyl-CoA synthetase (AMP-forming)/AMP-acid ligase II